MLLLLLLLLGVCTVHTLGVTLCGGSFSALRAHRGLRLLPSRAPLEERRHDLDTAVAVVLPIRVARYVGAVAARWTVGALHMLARIVLAIAVDGGGEER